jgi:outer membrane protein TolC
LKLLTQTSMWCVRAVCLAGLASLCSIHAAEEPETPEFIKPKKAEVLQPDKAHDDAKPIPASRQSDEETPLAVDDGKGPIVVRDPNPGPIATKSVHISLDAAIEIAIQSNLNLRLSRLDDRVSDINVRTAWAEFYPEFRAGVNHSNSRAVGQETGDGVNSFSGGIEQRTPFGTTLDIGVSETRTSLRRETAAGRVDINVTQPLWRGAGTDVGLADIRSARIRRLISRGELDLDVQTLIFQVRSAYADIIRQIQQRDVNLQAIRLGEQFLELSAARERAGQVTRLEVSNAELNLNTRKLELISNERALATAYDRLKTLMDVDLQENISVDAETLEFGDKPEANIERRIVSDEVSGAVMLVVTRDGKQEGEPRILFQATHFDSGVVLQEALDNRIDLLNRRRTLAVQKLQTLLARDGLGQQLDLVGGFGRSNAGRSVFERDNGSEVNDWTVGLNARLPWGKIRDKAAYEIALLNLQRAEIGLKAVRQTVELDVRDILRLLVENEKSLLIEGQRVENAKRTVDAAQSRFDRGLNDSFDVIRAQDDLQRAKQNFVTRKLQYVVNLADLEVRVGKPTGRVDLAGQSAGGLIDSRLDAIMKDGIPRRAPDAEARPEDDPFNKSREYRNDYKPDRTKTVVIDQGVSVQPAQPAEPDFSLPELKK